MTLLSDRAPGLLVEVTKLKQRLLFLSRSADGAKESDVTCYMLKSGFGKESTVSTIGQVFLSFCREAKFNSSTAELILQGCQH